MKLTKIFASCLVVLSVIFTLALIFRHPRSDRTIGFADARVLDNEGPEQNFMPIGVDDGESTTLWKLKCLSFVLAFHLMSLHPILSIRICLLI